MARWFRFYSDALHNPKVQCLSPFLFKVWINILCVASKYDGVLPDNKELARLLVLRPARCQLATRKLSEVGLLEQKTGHLTPHDWHQLQYTNDVSTQRVRAFRKRLQDVPETVSETSPDIQIQNTDKESKKYYFSSGFIRLNEADYKKWEEAYPKLNLKAELTAIAAWDQLTPKNWFHAVLSSLAKRHREVAAVAAVSEAEKTRQFKMKQAIP